MLKVRLNLLLSVNDINAYRINGYIIDNFYINYAVKEDLTPQVFKEYGLDYNLDKSKYKIEDGYHNLAVNFIATSLDEIKNLIHYLKNVDKNISYPFNLVAVDSYDDVYFYDEALINNSDEAIKHWVYYLKGELNINLIPDKPDYKYLIDMAKVNNKEVVELTSAYNIHYNNKSILNLIDDFIEYNQDKEEVSRQLKELKDFIIKDKEGQLMVNLNNSYMKVVKSVYLD